MPDREPLFERTYSRDELLAAMTIQPCHVTGTHDPQHTPRFICDYQRRDALNGLLGLIGATDDDLPRRPHDWPSSGDSGVLEDAWVNRRPITFSVSILPGEEFDDFSTAWGRACDARADQAGKPKFTVSAMTEGLTEPKVVAWW